MARRQVRPALALALAACTLAGACSSGTGATTGGTTTPGTLTPGTLTPGTLTPGTLTPGTLTPGTITTSTPTTSTISPAPDTAASTMGPLAPAAATGPATGGSLRGRIVVIDPGHNGSNWRHAREIAQLVNIGNGTKACDTTGTQTASGFTESAFTFDVSLRLAAVLRAAGATVVLTRPDDHGVGPCISQRAAIGNRAHADAAISIHGDGAPTSGYGFHVIVPRGIGSNDAIVTPSRRLGVDVRDAFRAGTGEALSTYTGTTTGRLVARSDLGGLNLSTVPKVFIECGNMRNASDARRMTSAAWRQRAAVALAAGLARYLAGG